SKAKTRIHSSRSAAASTFVVHVLFVRFARLTRSNRFVKLSAADCSARVSQFQRYRPVLRSGCEVEALVVQKFSRVGGVMAELLGSRSLSVPLIFHSSHTSSFRSSPLSFPGNHCVKKSPLGCRVFS